MAERKIDKVEYRVDPITAVEAIKLYSDILRFLGPAASRLPAVIMSIQAETEGQTMMADVAALAAVSDILSRASSDEVADLLGRIISLAEIKRPSGHYDKADLDGDFTGNLGGIMGLVRFVLEVQFSDFFPAKRQSGIISLLTEVLQTAKSSK